MEPEVIKYISEALRQGMSELQIKQSLLDSGWSVETVEQSFTHVKANLAQNAKPINPASTGIKVDPQPAIQPFTQPTGESSPVISHIVEPRSKKKWLFIGLGAAILLLILGFAGYWAYANGYYASLMPVGVWNKFMSKGQPDIYQNQFNFSYTDSSSSTGTQILNLNNVFLNVNGKFYIDNSQKQNPKSSTDLTYQVGSGNSSFQSGFQYLLLSNVLYLNIGNNPLLAMYEGALSQGSSSTPQWIKIDLNKLMDQANTQSSTDEKMALQQLTDPAFKNELSTMWQASNYIKMEKYLGRDKVNNAPALHFSNTLDKTALKNLINQTLDKVASKIDTSSSTEIQSSDLQNAKDGLGAVIDKIQIKQFEIWINPVNFQLVKVVLVSNAPSYLSTAQSLSGSGSPVNNDYQRINNISVLKNALTLYYNENKKYPPADSTTGQPIGLTPKYIPAIPVSPAPPDGNCTNYFNAYWYTVNSDYKDFSYTFCLGSSIDGYKAGIGRLSATGIATNITCPTLTTKPDKCVNQNAPTQADIIKNQVNAIPFTAQIKIDSTFSSYGIKQNLTAPDNAYDIMESVQTAQDKSRDAKRIADMRQIASGLELYYNDNNKYPATLNVLSPTYVGTIPTAPTPADGSCSDADNTYTYSQTNNGAAYNLTFCLGATTAGYSAGKHTMTEAGIK